MSKKTALWAGGIFVSFFAIYVFSWDRMYLLDTMAYAGHVERPVHSLLQALALHPDHALWLITGRAFYVLWHVFAPSVRGYQTLQLLNSLIGAFGLSLFFLILSRWTERSWAFLWTILLGLSWNYWQKSSGGDSYLAGTFWLILFCGSLLDYWGRPRLRGVIFMGLCAGLAMHYHLGNLAAWPAAFLIVSLRKGLRRSGADIAVMALFFAGTILLYGMGQGWFERGGLYSWWVSAAYVSPGKMSPAFLSVHFLNTLALSARAFVKAILYFKTPSWRPVVQGAAVVGLVTFAVSAGRRAKPGQATESQRAARRVAPAILFLLIVYTGFYTFWQPGNYWYWVMQPVFLGFFLGCWTFYGQASKLPRVQWAAFIVAAALLGAHNYRSDIRGRKNNSLQYVVDASEKIGRMTPPESRIVVSGGGDWGNLKCYLPYFGDRKCLSLDTVALDAQMRAIDPLYWMRTIIRAFLAEGIPVYITEDFLNVQSFAWGPRVYSGEELRFLWDGCTPRPIGRFEGRFSNGLFLLWPARFPEAVQASIRRRLAEAGLSAQAPPLTRERTAPF
jgi:hypothetical protein